MATSAERAYLGIGRQGTKLAHLVPAAVSGALQHILYGTMVLLPLTCARTRLKAAAACFFMNTDLLASGT
jgi:hypothetical protein